MNARNLRSEPKPARYVKDEGRKMKHNMIHIRKWCVFIDICRLTLLTIWYLEWHINSTTNPPTQYIIASFQGETMGDNLPCYLSQTLQMGTRWVLVTHYVKTFYYIRILCSERTTSWNKESYQGTSISMVDCHS